MGSVRKDDIPIAAGFMKDLWAYLKEHWVNDGTQEYWDSVVDDAEGIYQKYKAIIAQEDDQSASEQGVVIEAILVAACSALEKKKHVRRKGK